LPAVPKAAPKIKVSAAEWYVLLAEFEEIKLFREELLHTIDRIRDVHEPGMVGC